VAVTCASASGGLTQALNHITYSRIAKSESSTEGNAHVLRRRTILGALFSVAVAVPVILLVIFFGETLFGTGYHGLPLITAILVISPFLNDQWQLRIYMDSAAENSSSLTVASALGLAVLATSAWMFHTFGRLDGSEMAFCVVLFGATRLLARGYFRRKYVG
jgi:hypothetical protein